jgi:hypothetical protein
MKKTRAKMGGGRREEEGRGIDSIRISSRVDSTQV